MSLPYHIGNGVFGGMLPLLFTAMVAASGDIYYGLWYPIVVAVMTVIVGALSSAIRGDEHPTDSGIGGRAAARHRVRPGARRLQAAGRSVSGPAARWRGAEEGRARRAARRARRRRAEPRRRKPGDVANDCEAEAAPRLRLVEPGTALEHALAEFGSEPRAVILDRGAKAVAFVAHRDLHPRTRPFARIVEQISEHLLEVLPLAARIRAAAGRSTSQSRCRARHRCAASVAPEAATTPCHRDAGAERDQRCLPPAPGSR